MVLANSIIFLAGLVLLVKGSDFFTKSSASIAKRVGVSDFVIGLTFVAIATSLPELASSIAAAVRHQSGIVIGNIVGSNAANGALIIGVTAIIVGIKTRKTMVKRDGYIMLFASLLLFVFAFGGVISRLESAFFLLLYFAYLTFLFGAKPKPKEKYQFRQFLRYFFEFRYLVTIRSRLVERAKRKSREKTKAKALEKKRKLIELLEAAIIKDFLVAALSLLAIFFGAEYMVREAIFFADFFNISGTLIGVSIIALGTSLPELSVSISAARKGYGDIAFGNIIGSNISNILFVLGVSGLISPLLVNGLSLTLAIPFMIAISFALIIFARSGWEIKNIEGTTLLILYTLFLILLFS